MKKITLTLLAVVFSAALAYGSSITPFSGPQDPSQIQAYLNSLINSISTGVNGLVANATGVVSSTATTAEQTLASVTVPANVLTKNGQSLRVRCSGVLGNTSHANTSVKIYYGTSAVASTNATTSGQAFNVELISTYNASPTSSVYSAFGHMGTVEFTPVATANTTDNLASALVAKCTATQGTASAADVVLTNLIVEQVK